MFYQSQKHTQLEYSKVTNHILLQIKKTFSINGLIGLSKCSISGSSYPIFDTLPHSILLRLNSPMVRKIYKDLRLTMCIQKYPQPCLTIDSLGMNSIFEFYNVLFSSTITYNILTVAN